MERLNAELTGTLTRLQAAQEKLVEAERMATVGRLSLKVAHEVRNPIAAIELNAELLGDIVQERPGARTWNEATALVAVDPRAGGRPRRAHRGVPGLRALPAAAVRGGLRQRHGERRSSEFVRPLAAPPGDHGRRWRRIPPCPPMEIDRTLLRQAVLNLVKNGLEALSQGGTPDA